ncbi:MAG: hypothetical protein WCP24_00065 [bacterium]
MVLKQGEKFMPAKTFDEQMVQVLNGSNSLKELQPILRLIQTRSIPGGHEALRQAVSEVGNRLGSKVFGFLKAGFRNEINQTLAYLLSEEARVNKETKAKTMLAQPKTG